MNKYLFQFLTFLLSMSSVAQQVELAPQKGHSSAIDRIEFSENGNYIISWSLNNEGIIWDLNFRKALTRFKLPESDEIIGIKFIENDEKVKIQSKKSTYLFEISSDALETRPFDGDTLFRKKDTFNDPDGLHKTFIKKGAIKKEKKDRFFARYWISVTYTNASFYAFDVSKENDLIVGVAENNAIYCYTYQRGKKIVIMQEHNSPARDVRFSPDGKFFATAGKDRSIIIWDAKNYRVKFRLYSNIFRKNTAVFSHNGNEIHIGDELGNLYSVDFNALFPNTRVTNYPQSINNIKKSSFKGDQAYYVSNSNNSLEIKKDLSSFSAAETVKFREHELTRSKGLLLQNLFGLYQEPIGEVLTCDISLDNKAVLLTGKTDIPNITLAYPERQEVKHLYAYEDNRNWKDARFTEKDQFVSLLENSGTLYFWRKENGDYFFRKDSLPFMLNDFRVLNPNTLWLSSRERGQFIYKIDQKKYLQVSEINAHSLFFDRNLIILSDHEHRIVFLNAETYTVEASFTGHSDRVTDISFHPSKNVFISSSDDGTVKLWDFSKKELIASIIPFQNNEVVIITADNYYLISKGAIDEIGFRYQGQFFYPDQFDLKYNRPDLVLEKLGYMNKDLITAYERAYEKRLKKLNLTEKALSSDFHLPEVQILNKEKIPGETASKKLELELSLSDSKHKLESYKVWINEVAVLGSLGHNIRSLDTAELTVTVPLNLSYGDNKIEVSTLNQSGAESFKEVINVYCKEGKKKPNAYVVTIGVSKYADKRFNLAYAAKDAADMEKLFNESDFFGSVYTKSLTDKEVNLENLEELTEFLAQADVDDFVLIFVAGHGILDENFDYYFASHDIDFDDPSKRGIPYKKIEELIDGIKALKKLLILDTCHSGEIDKEEVEKNEHITIDSTEEWRFRNVGAGISFKDDPLGFKNINYLMKQVFLDLRRGTGATVISSSGGTELAFESSKYENGLFTYSLIHALKSRKADLNNDKTITVSELQEYVIEEVKKLSNGNQVPTSRMHNKEMDYRVW
ncbi:MAG: caspase family protein [Brumimicrobium sp.]|nr:caspase family protein [Brumimicrobium sp.]